MLFWVILVGVWVTAVRARTVVATSVSSQHHAQDELGQYSYGYTNPLSAKEELKTADGITRGGYSYLDAHGLVQNVNYVSDDVNGFRVATTNLSAVLAGQEPVVADNNAAHASPNVFVRPIIVAPISEQVQVAEKTPLVDARPIVVAEVPVPIINKATPVLLPSPVVLSEPVLSVEEPTYISSPAPPQVAPLAPAIAPVSSSIPIAPAIAPASLSIPTAPDIAPASSSIPTAPAIAPPAATVYLSSVPAPAPVVVTAVSAQHHSQDELGQYSYGYVNPLSAKKEVKTVDGITRGGYSYVDSHGLVQNVNYVSDDVNGFRVAASNIPQQVQPVHIPDSHDVAVAKAKFFAAIADAKGAVGEK